MIKLQFFHKQSQKIQTKTKKFNKRNTKLNDKTERNEK